MFMDKATVLLVEDETKLLETLSDFLEINHYNVIQATDGLDGIQKFHAHRSEIDIVLLDVMLPFTDGYEVLKPYSLSIIKLHIEAVLKRFGHGEDFLYAGDVRIEVKAKKIYVRDVFVETTPKEFELLHLLIRNQGTVLTRDYILDTIWGDYYVGDVRTIDTIVKQFRKKLGGASYIRTVYGVGYCFEVEGNEKKN